MNKKLRNKITVFVSLLLSCQNKASASDVVAKNTNYSHSFGVNDNKGDQSFLDKLDNNPAFKLSLLTNGLFVTGIVTYVILKHVMGRVDEKFEEDRKKREEQKENEAEELRCLVDKFLELKEWKVLNNADNLCCNRWHTIEYLKKNNIKFGSKETLPFLKFKDKSFGELDKQANLHLDWVRDNWVKCRKDLKIENFAPENEEFATITVKGKFLFDGDVRIGIIYDKKTQVPISLNFVNVGIVHSAYDVCSDSVRCQWTWVYNKK